MIVGAFDLNLYCNNLEDKRYHKHPYTDECEGRHTGQSDYMGETRAGCYKQARHEGWYINKRRQLCPTCATLPRRGMTGRY